MLLLADVLHLPRITLKNEDEAVSLQHLPVLRHQGEIRGEGGGDRLEHLLQHPLPLEPIPPDLLTFLLHVS